MGLFVASIWGGALNFGFYRWWDQEIDLPEKSTGLVLVSPEATSSFRWCGIVWRRVFGGGHMLKPHSMTVNLPVCVFPQKKKEGHVPSSASPFHALPFVHTSSSRSSSLPVASPKLSESEVAQLCPTLWTPWTVAHQAPPSMGFSRQEY